MLTFVRRVRVRLGAEGGFTLIELMAAMLVLSIGIFSVVELTTNQMTKSLGTRERDAAITLANQQVETLRSTPFGNLKLNPSGSIPGSYTDSDNTTYTPLVASSSSAAYVSYQQTVPLSPFSFTVTTIIAAIDDPADGLGAQDQNSNTLDYKKAFVTISASQPAAIAYKVETIIRDTSNDPVTPVQGLQIQILDTTATQVQDDNLTWSLDISGAGIAGEEVDEGEYDNYALLSGSYTCTLTNDDSTREWYPLGFPNATSDTFPCVVSAGQITTYQRTWVQPTDCQVLPGQYGDLTVNVTDSTTGVGIGGATVDPVPTGGQTPDPTPQVTSSSGTVVGGATFTQIPTGPYSLTVSATGYQTSSTFQACVTPTQGVATPVSLQATGPSPSPSASPPPTNATVNVLVKWNGGGTKTFRVYLSATTVLSQDISHAQTKTFTFSVPAGSYYVQVYCVAGHKEDLRESSMNQPFSSNTSYYYPGPGTANSYVETKC